MINCLRINTVGEITHARFQELVGLLGDRKGLFHW